MVLIRDAAKADTVNPREVAIFKPSRRLREHSKNTNAGLTRLRQVRKNERERAPIT